MNFLKVFTLKAALRLHTLWVLVVSSHPITIGKQNTSTETTQGDEGRGPWRGRRVGGVYQFIMEFLFKVMKKTWLLPPDRTEAKKTCQQNRRQTDVSVTHSDPFRASHLPKVFGVDTETPHVPEINTDTTETTTKPTLSFLSDRNFSR